MARESRNAILRVLRRQQDIVPADGNNATDESHFSVVLFPSERCTVTRSYHDKITFLYRFRQIRVRIREFQVKDVYMRESAISNNTRTITITDPKRELLRHTVATLAYRAGKTLRDAPENFASFRPGETTRTPVQILAHVGDLLDWALSLAAGEQKWNDATPLPWEQELERFFQTLKKFDDYLASQAPLEGSCEKIFQGPIADALTHVGQLAMLRRLAGSPVRAENYHKAEIQIGRVGPEQSNKRMEFDRENETGRVSFAQ